MNINIDELTASELVEPNLRIVERLKLLESVHNDQEMMRFAPDETVSFEPPGRELQIGTLVKYNNKTVTVIIESGLKWSVSPQLLRKVKDAGQGHTNARTIDASRPDRDA